VKGLQSGVALRMAAKELHRKASVAEGIQMLIDVNEAIDLLTPKPWHVRLRRAVGGWLVRLGERISP
jgi:hypothetical protein